MKKNPDCLHRDKVYRHRAYVWLPENQKHWVDFLPSNCMWDAPFKPATVPMFFMNLIIGNSCISGVMWGTN